MRKPAATTVLLVVNVFVNLGTYLFMPLLALSLLDRGFTKAQAGTVAGLMFGTGLLCAVWLGQWGARFGSRFLAVGGAALRSADITRALGLSGTVIGLGLIVGSSFGGWLMDRFGLPAMALLTMAAAVSGIVAARALRGYLPPGEV